MESGVITFVLDKETLNIDEKEVLRYLGYGKQDAKVADTTQIMSAIEEIRPQLMIRACYRRCNVRLDDNNVIQMPYGEITSRHLSINLDGCNEIYVIAATIGAAFDRMLARAKMQSMAKAAIYQAVGATAVEEVVDQLYAFLKNEALKNGEDIKVRYSPGFGDYVLENQVGIFKTLTPEKYTGITLNDSLIMAPEKSVTAVIGIVKQNK